MRHYRIVLFNSYEPATMSLLHVSNWCCLPLCHIAFYEEHISLYNCRLGMKLNIYWMTMKIWRICTWQGSGSRINNLRPCWELLSQIASTPLHLIFLELVLKGVGVWWATICMIMMLRIWRCCLRHILCSWMEHVTRYCLWVLPSDPSMSSNYILKYNFSANFFFLEAVLDESFYYCQV